MDGDHVDLAELVKNAKQIVNFLFIRKLRLFSDFSPPHTIKFCEGKLQKKRFKLVEFE